MEIDRCSPMNMKDNIVEKRKNAVAKSLEK
jgi:hypothetical protein